MIYAVIPTGNRPKEYKSVIEWCEEHAVIPITIATTEQAMRYGRGIVMRGEGLNISKWWNIGLEFAYDNGATTVFVLNDDVQLPFNWAEKMLDVLKRGVAGASTVRGTNLIAGYAFALKAEHRILADENLVWWYGDDDIQRQCEQLGGFGFSHSIRVRNLYANSSVDRFKEQIEKDREYYQQKWGL